MYKVLMKRNIHFSKVEPRKICKNILVHKVKENNLISLNNWYIYLKNIYDSRDIMGTILNTLIKEDIFSLEDMEFWIKCLSNGKIRDIEGYQVEIFKMERSILIPSIHKPLNLIVKQGFPKPWMKRFIVLIFKSGDKNIPSNYRTIIIRHVYPIYMDSF